MKKKRIKHIILILLAVLLIVVSALLFCFHIFPPIKLYFSNNAHYYDSTPDDVCIEIANGRMTLTTGKTEWIHREDHYAYAYDYGFYTTEESITKTVHLPLWRLIQIYSACDWQDFRGDAVKDVTQTFVAILEDHGYHRSSTYCWEDGYRGDPERDVITSVLAAVPERIMALPEFEYLASYQQKNVVEDSAVTASEEQAEYARSLSEWEIVDIPDIGSISLPKQLHYQEQGNLIYIMNQPEDDSIAPTPALIGIKYESSAAAQMLAYLEQINAAEPLAPSEVLSNSVTSGELRFVVDGVPKTKRFLHLASPDKNLLLIVVDERIAADIDAISLPFLEHTAE